MTHELDPLHLPLAGSRLIEASAGTGKTWTIAALYLRLVLGHGTVPRRTGQTQGGPLTPADILVMTFTRAATRELSDRIRARLLEAAQCFRGQAQPAPQDRFMVELMAAYPEGAQRTAAAWRLALAAESMDDAAIHTIDAWCQRVLREHAFDSGNLFDEELVADEEGLIAAAAQDYWRQQLYPLAGPELDAALAVWPSVERLAADARALLRQAWPREAGQGSLAQALARLQAERLAALAPLKAGWVEGAARLRHWLDEQTAPKTCPWDRRKLMAKNYGNWLQRLADWAADPQALAPDWTDSAWARMSPAGFQEARKDGAPVDLWLPEGLERLGELREQLAQVPDPAAGLRLHAAARIHERLAWLKRQSASFGFDDLLQRLDRALAGAQGERLRQRLLARYPVALIDEFQDTSPLQYRLFEQIYQPEANDPASALLLIGDPKQSIYGFRGADIHSYLRARRATTGRHHALGVNHRSTAAVVDAVNQWFLLAEERPGEAAFQFRSTANTPTGEADNPLPFLPVSARGRAQTLVCASGEVPALTLVADLELRSTQAAQRLNATRCAEQIVSWLNDGRAGLAEPVENNQPDQTGEPGPTDPPSQPSPRLQALRPADIAVLVRTGREAASVRAELRRRGVASVYLSDQDSVFASAEAGDLLRWLRAVAQPQDMRLARAALATATVGLSLDELAELAADDEALDARAAEFRRLHRVWQTQGVLTLLRHSLHSLELPARWLEEADGERRLTNLLHLAELLQAASSRLEGEQALIRWLQLEIAAATPGARGGAAPSRSDEAILRLESDADLVKVVTIHKSKGLEYPIVCLPFACAHRPVTRKGTAFVNLANALGQRELHLQLTPERIAAADRERLREDLRLFYVALTRARHALWVGVSALKSGNSKDCTAPRSAPGYLLGGQGPLDADGLGAALQDLAERSPGIRLIAADAAPPFTWLRRRQALTELADTPAYRADFDRRWSIGSFSQLVRAMAPPTLPLAPGHGLRPADDEQEPVGDQALGLGEVEESATAETTTEPDPQPNPTPWHDFQRGPLAGNFLHAQLEWLAGEGFALNAPGSEAERLAQRLLRRCERAGHEVDQAQGVLSWMRRLLSQPLPGPGVALQALQGPLPEMEFWLPSAGLHAQAVDALCRRHLLPGQPRPELPARELHGLLMGFADLVFEHDGRYWVLDYKSNRLGDDNSAYGPDALAAAVLAHRYELQAALYQLALHRLLAQRLGAAYQPEHHLGGALVWFIRGVGSPGGGVCHLPTRLPLLQALDALLREGPPDAETAARSTDQRLADSADNLATDAHSGDPADPLNTDAEAQP